MVSLLSVPLPSLAPLRGVSISYPTIYLPLTCHNLYREVSLWSPASSYFPWWTAWLPSPGQFSSHILHLCPVMKFNSVDASPTSMRVITRHLPTTWGSAELLREGIGHRATASEPHFLACDTVQIVNSVCDCVS